MKIVLTLFIIAILAVIVGLMPTDTTLEDALNWKVFFGEFCFSIAPVVARAIGEKNI